ncbi:1-phosphofructokinase [Halobacillus sp. Cin3]|uniref:1-phosphofructokinase n=1 Tax=Halobacillus sp. Cin3 TaxID=2928441 RepID=UPI00248F1F3F|nr:1-phosphofructokinase [Halobacillus sp. Cin3]
MIYTCTLNPSIDYIMHVDSFEAGGLNRAGQTFFYPGGKGINVSRVVNRLGVQSRALGFIGGFSGDFISDFLDEEGVQHQFMNTGQKTRVNVKLKSGDETEINGPGPALAEDMQQALLDQIQHLTSEDILVLAGSVPSSLPGDYYEKITTICERNHTKVVLDTSGEALKQILGQTLFLMKPNHHELGDLFNAEINTPEDAALYGKKLVEQGVENVIVSMGGQGAVYVGREEQWYANVPEGTVKNSVGAGDSVVAGFLAAYSEGKSIAEAFRFGVASGSATAFQDDLCQQEDVLQLLEQINVSPIQ